MSDDNIEESLSSLAKAIRDEQLSHKSHKDIMANNSSKSIELNAIDNERFFKKIYSFSKPKEQRKQLYLWKNKLDLLDSELKNLEYTKSIIIEPGQPSIVHVEKFSFQIARLTILILAATIILSIISLINLEIRESIFPEIIVTILFSCLGIWHLHTSLIKPANILKRRGIAHGVKVNLIKEPQQSKDVASKNNIISINIKSK